MAETSFVVVFRDDEAGYLRWCIDHPQGYVVNCGWQHNRLDPNYYCLPLQRHLGIDSEWGSFYAVLLTPIAREEKIACYRLVVPQGSLTCSAL